MEVGGGLGAGLSRYAGVVTMLVLSRRAGERLVIMLGDQVVEVCYLGQRSGQGRIGVIADRTVTVLRAELIEEDRPVHEPSCRS